MGLSWVHSQIVRALASSPLCSLSTSCYTRPWNIESQKNFNQIKFFSVYLLYDANLYKPITVLYALCNLCEMYPRNLITPPFHKAAICGALWERNRAPWRAQRSSKTLIYRWLVSNWSPWSPRSPSVDSLAQRSVAIRSERKQIVTWSHRS